MPVKLPLDEATASRLQSQLPVQKRILAIHQKREKLDQFEFYPAHDPRKATPEYRAAHKKLVADQDRPCLICGVRQSTLKDPAKNLYSASQMETHHHIVEWSLANAVDVDKFNTHLLPNLRRRHPDQPEYRKNFTADEIANWVDHSEDNLWVLCDVHHRTKFFGIHALTDPIWGPQDLLRDDFEDYVRKTLAEIKAIEKSGTGKTK